MAKIKQLFLLMCLLVSVFSYSQIIVGAERTNSYIQLIQEKKIAIVGNQSSLIQKKHLVDSLLKRNINIIKVFSPEMVLEELKMLELRLKTELMKKQEFL